MPTPYSKLTISGLNALLSTTLGNLKPFQLDQVKEALDRINYNRGSNSDVSVQSTITTIAASFSSNNP